MPRSTPAAPRAVRRPAGSVRPRRALGTLLVLLALVGASLPTAAFAATSVPLTGGHLDWRINDNMRFQGSWAQISTATAPAERLTVDPTSSGGIPIDLDVFRFPIGDGSTYDPATGDATLLLEGSVTVGNSNRGTYTLTLSALTVEVTAGTATLGATVAGETAPGTFGGVEEPGGPFGPTRVDVVSRFAAEVTEGADGALSLVGTPQLDLGPAGTARGFSTAFLDAIPASLRSWFVLTGDDPGTTTNVRKAASPIDVVLLPGEAPTPPPSGGGDDGGDDGEPAPIVPRQVTATASTTQLTAGGTVTVGAGGFVPDETVAIELRSDPVDLGTTQADGDGDVSTDVTIPEDTPPGTHTIALIGAEQEATVTILVEGTQGGQVTDGALDWGVKSSFRSYILGPVASGSIETTDGAESVGDLFRFPATDGSYDAEAGTLDVTFTGTVTFTGHVIGGSPLLDLTVSDPRVVLGPDGGTLFLDVDSLPLGDDERLVADDVAFAELTLPGGVPDPVDGVISLSGVPATLTQAGAEAFAGFYAAGDDLDPLTITVAIDDAEVTLPSLPDGTAGGGGPDAGAGEPTAGVGTGVTAPTPQTTLPTAAATQDTLPATGGTTAALLALAALLLGAGALVLRSSPSRGAPTRR